MTRIFLCYAAAALSLSGCAALGAIAGSSAGQVLSVTGAIAVETAAQQRCPAKPTELAALVSARVAFDIGLAPMLDVGKLRQVAIARAATDAICGIVVTEGPPPAPPPTS